mmetsp:Transcript_5750/g.10265  ORF Transcript_5750/g.10265 Transcript_5750/m.10265 type:complete len:633 (+) Transcript_5750:2191-4089(+)|eukprot:CAMPEP_0204903792 /NCGR_PEP_ID=MMETSP1397-20131031/4483_1 /ASSEMBLY_ACC=CAM_ASM_000891 /TAXON_ID=49980 /ORGANISM="Climacostomum Climacostomum virens, Strain Stock W-24" /LENGTH=632 /DNA_ID=CAMNT_0052072495 /DNA_START=2083 /DNA_END=3981 /DNA_ORIENTATION=-
MKFEKWFADNKLDAWVHNYLRFLKLKELLKSGNVDLFAAKFKADILRVNSFYCGILELHKGRWIVAKEALDIALKIEDPKAKERELYSQKELIEATYTGLMHLQDYSNVNYKAAAHLLLKLKKEEHSEHINANLKSFLISAGFVEEVIENTLQNGSLRLMNEIEAKVAEVYFNGSLRSAKHSLKSFSRTKQLTRGDTFWLGIFIGMTVMISAVIGVICIIRNLSADTDKHFRLVFPMYRCLIIFSLYALLLGWNVYGWNSYCINFKHLLKFRLNFAPATKFLMRGAMISNIVMICFFWYILDRLEFLNHKKIHDYFTPLLAWFFILVWIFYPVHKWVSYSGRTFLLTVVAESLISPFSNVEFRHVFIMDQAISLVVPLKDIEYSICFLANGGVHAATPEYCYEPGRYLPLCVTLLPYLIRTLQCLHLVYEAKTFRHPQIINAGKYMSSVIVIILNFIYNTVGPTLLPVWVVFSFLSTIYSFAWDLKKDWGLLEPGSKFLRRKLLFKPTMVYYFVIGINLILRFSWTLTISPVVVSTFVVPELLTLMTGMLEAYRRIQWNFLRMEWEQLATKGVTDASEFKMNLAKPLAPFVDEDMEDVAAINSKLVYYRSLLASKSKNATPSESELDSLNST